MAFGHGTNAVLKIMDAVPTLRDFSAYIDEAGLPRSVEAAEVTTLGKVKKVYIAGLEDGTISLKGFWDPTVDGYLDGLRRKVTTWEYYPAGLGAGNVKYSGSAVMTQFDVSGSTSGATTFTATFQQSDVVTRAVL